MGSQTLKICHQNRWQECGLAESAVTDDGRSRTKALNPLVERSSLLPLRARRFGTSQVSCLASVISTPEDLRLKPRCFSEKYAQACHSTSSDALSTERRKTWLT